MALSVDASATRVSATNTFSGSPVSVTKSGVVVPSNSLLIAAINCFESNANKCTSSSVTTSGLTWTKQKELGSNTNGGGASSAGYAAVFTAPDSAGGTRNIQAQCGHQDDFNGYDISLKVYRVTGHAGSPIGASSSGGPTADSGSGISPTVIGSTTGIGRVFYVGTEQNGESGSPGAPTSTDTVDAAYISTVLGALAAYKASNHSAGASVSGNLDAAGATQWNWVSIEILEATSGGPAPSAGALALSGAAPVVSQGTVRTPNVAALALTGIAALALGTRVPTAGSLALSSSAPTVIQGTVLQPSSGALAFTGNNAVTTGIRITSTGSAAFAGVAPTLSQGTGRVPAVGAIAINGNAPTVTQGGVGNSSITPNVGSIAFSGFVAIQDLGVPSPPSASLVINGAAPAISLGFTRQPNAGALALTGVAPIIFQGPNIFPSTATVSISGAAPSVTQQFYRVPVVGALSINGASPTINGTANNSITPNAGALGVSGAAPAITLQVTINPATGALAITGSLPAIAGYSVIVPGTGALSLAGQSLFVQGRAATPNTGALALTGRAPTVILLELPSYRRLVVVGRLRIVELPEYP